MLPAGSDSNVVISVKLKRKLSFNGHIYFEPLRPEAVKSALEYLQHLNLCSDIVIAIDQILSDLLSLVTDLNECVDKKNDQNLEEDENPLEEMRVASNETLLISHIHCAFDEKKIS